MFGASIFLYFENQVFNHKKEKDMKNTEDYKVIVIGAGQAGLSVGYYLSKLRVPFVILDASKRIGDSWRTRWESLRLFTPAKYDGLAGMPFPASPNYFPSKDEMADYLENYAHHFNLPVRSGMRVEGLSREGKKYCVRAGGQHFQAEHVVVAMSSFQIPKKPQFAQKLDKDINQFHSLDYKDPSQFRDGPVLVVGAGNSGAEIALEAARNNHQVWLSGRHPGHIPFQIESTLSKLILMRLVLEVLYHRILKTNNPIGRKARSKFVNGGTPLIRIKPKEFLKAGIEQVPRVKGIKDGFPLLEDGRVLDVKNVVWCTGFYPSHSWIDISIFKDREPMHDRGVVENEPGLYFTGLHFLYSPSSTMVLGAARDARHIVKRIDRRLKTNRKPVTI